MYDINGNLKVGYTNERSVPYMLIDMATHKTQELRLRTPNEAADLNHALRLTNMRWIPSAI